MLARDQLSRLEEIERDISNLPQWAYTEPLPIHDKNIPPHQEQEVTHISNVPTSHYIISIYPGDPSFTVETDLKTELIAKLYTQRNHWLPSYGPWYSALTAVAMQKRFFPKELKGNDNFHNSTSQKLMQAITSTLSGITEDLYVDVRHLSDTNAALCLLNAYCVMKGQAALPKTFQDLGKDLDLKLDILVHDLKQPGGFSTQGFQFTYENTIQTSTVAPVGKRDRYPLSFFQHHKLVQLFINAGVLPRLDSEDTVQIHQDVIYVITNAIFGEDIPPFASYQWNLRVGIVALEYLILVHVLTENIHVRDPGNSRLNFKSLLGSSFQLGQSDPLIQSTFRRGQAFKHLSTNYIIPTITSDPQIPISKLFPGISILGLEIQSHAPGHASIINLSGQKFSDIIDVITQQSMIKDAPQLLQSRVTLRFKVESGLARLLAQPSPRLTASDIIKTQFGGLDDYDRIYFLVLGFLPVTSPVI